MDKVEKEHLLDEAYKYIRGEPSEISGRLGKVGNLSLLENSDEYRRATMVKEILADYAERPSPKRPFCLAVFGPPGSGKSTIVKNILSSLGGKFSKLTEINVSQIQGEKELAPLLPHEALEGSKIPVIFFDEFDSSLAGRSLGWLKSFLSLMQDGYFGSSESESILKKSVLVFAGGTAESMDRFQQSTSQNQAEYRALKVPDFISRLHAFLDVEGINGKLEERIIRRAVALKFQLNERGLATPEIDRGLLEDILHSSHFIHNQRSLQALIEVSKFFEPGRFDKKCLPGFPVGATTADPNQGDKLLSLHISRGPLDGKLVGISTGQKDVRNSRFHAGLSDSLFMNGARLAYGGDLEDESVLQGLIKSAQEAPQGLLHRPLASIRNYLAYPSYLREPVVDQIKSRRENSKDWIEFEELATLSEAELNYFGFAHGEHFSALPSPGGSYAVSRHLAWSISLFRMRLRMLQDVDALVVIGGKTTDSWGRSLGIAEEVMIAQALRKPVFILGGAGGAAAIVGRGLGLGDAFCYGPLLDAEAGDSSQTGYLKAQYVDTLKSKFSECFQIPGKAQSPVTSDEIMASFRENYFGGPGWTPNGLTASENYKLFKLDPNLKGEELIELIVEGVQRA